MATDQRSMADPIVSQIMDTKQQMLGIQYHALPVSAIRRTGLSPELGINSTPDPAAIRESVSDLEDPVRVQSLTFPYSIKMHVANSTKDDSDLTSLSDLDSDEYTSDKFNLDSDYSAPDSDEEDYYEEDETKLESEEQVDPAEPIQAQKSPSLEIMDDDKEVEDEDNGMNVDLKELLEDKNEDADLEAKVGALESNIDVLDLDIIPTQGVDGDDNEDVQYILPDINRAPQTPEPDEEFAHKDGLHFQEICDQHLYVLFSRVQEFH
jgi:hypothetical protein